MVRLEESTEGTRRRVPGQEVTEARPQEGSHVTVSSALGCGYQKEEGCRAGTAQPGGQWEGPVEEA